MLKICRILWNLHLVANNTGNIDMTINSIKPRKYKKMMFPAEGCYNFMAIRVWNLK